MAAPSLSAAVLVYNGARTIERCIEQLGFCDEIVVVDDGSTDGTWELIQRLPVRSIQHSHETFAEQRAYARDLTTGEWLLTMDADEYVTPELRAAIRRAIARTGRDGFYLRRRNPYPLGLRGAHWSWHPRLVRRDRSRWLPTDSPHAPLDTRGLRLRKLRGAHLEHEPVGDLASALRKSINRNIILAEQLRARGRRVGAWRLLASTLARFFKMYFRGGGFRHGRDGFVWACSMAFEPFAKYAMLIARHPAVRTAAQDGGPGSYPPDAPVAVVEGVREGDGTADGD
ncbi:MAG: glycosyltransferase family 2 protein [Deltaproteobacteria bacterium]|nr:glycosyltransferase family 2 protein [Deltaproteobacteria bacterium]